jgi:hypothetical protein
MIDLLAVLDGKIAELRQQLETHLAARKLLVKEQGTPTKPKRKISAAGLAAIKEGQRKRRLAEAKKKKAR